MKTLSLWQPWAALILSGAKGVETRDWPFRQGGKFYRGPLLIHAAQHFTEAERRLCFQAEFATGMMGSHCFLREEIEERVAKMPRGAIIALAQMEGCYQVGLHHQGPPLNTLERHFGNYAPGRWMWWLRDVRPLREPYPVRGMQKIFEVDIPDEYLATLLPPVPYFGNRSMDEIA